MKRKVAIICLLGALLLGISTVEEVKADLLWHLDFEGNLDDTAGHASGPYNAMEVAPPIDGGSTAFVSGGRIGQALEFDGSNVRIDVPGTVSPMTEFTVAYFMTSSEDWYNSSMAFVTKPQWSTGNFVMRSIPNDDNEMWNDVGNTSLGVDGTFWSGSHPAYIDRWNHFAMTYSVTAGETKLYFDGELVASATGSSDPVEFNDGFALGAWNYSDDQPYNDRLTGQLDDVRFYDGALDADAIADLAFPASSPFVAHGPEPANRATGVPVDAILGWETGVDPVDANVPNPAITGHNLWLSIAYDPNNPPVDPNWLDPGVQFIELPAETAFYAPVLQPDALYFWIVDESLGAANPQDLDNILPGSQWSFGTVASEPELDAVEVEVSSLWIFQDSWAATAVSGYLGDQEVWSVPAEHPEEWVEITAGAGHRIDSVVCEGAYSRIDDMTILGGSAVLTFSDLEGAEAPVPEDYQPVELEGTGIQTTWTGWSLFNDDLVGEGLVDHSKSWNTDVESIYVFVGDNGGSIEFTSAAEAN